MLGLAQVDPGFAGTSAMLILRMEDGIEVLRLGSVQVHRPSFAQTSTMQILKTKDVWIGLQILELAQARQLNSRETLKMLQMRTKKREGGNDGGRTS